MKITKEMIEAANAAEYEMKITKEMIEKALVAWFGGRPTKMSGLDSEAYCYMRLAIRAVAPLIVEECARVADDAAREAQASLLSSTHSAPMFGAIMHAHVRAAAAIRALAKEPAQAEEEK